jgi:hypothetical protein
LSGLTANKNDPKKSANGNICSNLSEEVISKVIQNQNNECKHSRMQGSFEPPLQAATAGNAPFTE